MAESANRFQHLFSILDRLLPLRQKNGIQKKKSYFRAEGSSLEGTGQWLFMQKWHAKDQVWKITNSQDPDLTAKFILYMYMYILLKFCLTDSNL